LFHGSKLDNLTTVREPLERRLKWLAVEHDREMSRDGRLAVLDP
jgi:hypothetical protein